MKKIFVLLITFLFVMGCTGLQTQKERELEERIEALEASGVGASFRPFSGGLDSEDATGELQDVTGTGDKDVGLVVLESYTGGSAEGPWTGISVGNIWGIWVLDATGGSGDNWPEYGASGDGGNERWEYAGMYKVKTDTFYVAGKRTLSGTNPPADVAIMTSTNKVNVRKFDSGTDEDLQINWQVPIDFLPNYQKIKFRVITMVTESTTPSNTGWSFFLQGASIGTGDGLAATLGSAVESNVGDRSDAQYDIVYSTWSSPVTITDLIAGDYVLFKLYRDVSDADDDYEQDIGLIGLQIKYPSKASAEW